jgi:glycosyltransferase involved in cell wall biosynthesis
MREGRELTGIEMRNRAATVRILEIGNHPPPVCGWSIQTTLVKHELCRRGFTVAVLNINENRKQKSSNYVDVQDGPDFVGKLVYFAAKGYRFHIHFNALSGKSLLLSLGSALVGKSFGRDAILSFHGGLPQRLFPVERPLWLRAAFKMLFRLGQYTTCDSEEIRQNIVGYGIKPNRVKAIPCVSSELLEWRAVKLPEGVESFLTDHFPVFFAYVRLRKEYGFEVLLHAMEHYAAEYPDSGFIWVGPSAREFNEIKRIIEASNVTARNVMLVPNLEHNDFMTIMARCFATIRAHHCDGVSASVLESLALNVPVIACEDGRRPASVITYDGRNPFDLLEKLKYVTKNHATIKAGISIPRIGHNTDALVDLLLSVGSRGS